MEITLRRNIWIKAVTNTHGKYIKHTTICHGHIIIITNRGIFRYFIYISLTIINHQQIIKISPTHYQHAINYKKAWYICHAI